MATPSPERGREIPDYKQELEAKFRASRYNGKQFMELASAELMSKEYSLIQGEMFGKPDASKEKVTQETINQYFNGLGGDEFSRDLFEKGKKALLEELKDPEKCWKKYAKILDFKSSVVFDSKRTQEEKKESDRGVAILLDKDVTMYQELSLKDAIANQFFPKAENIMLMANVQNIIQAALEVWNTQDEKSRTKALRKNKETSGSVSRRKALQERIKDYDRTLHIAKYEIGKSEMSPESSSAIPKFDKTLKYKAIGSVNVATWDSKKIRSEAEWRGRWKSLAQEYISLQASGRLYNQFPTYVSESEKVSGVMDAIIRLSVGLKGKDETFDAKEFKKELDKKFGKEIIYGSYGVFNMLLAIERANKEVAKHDEQSKILYELQVGKGKSTKHLFSKLDAKALAEGEVKDAKAQDATVPKEKEKGEPKKEPEKEPDKKEKKEVVKQDPNVEFITALSGKLQAEYPLLKDKVKWESTENKDRVIVTVKDTEGKDIVSISWEKRTAKFYVKSTLKGGRPDIFDPTEAGKKSAVEIFKIELEEYFKPKAPAKAPAPKDTEPKLSKEAEEERGWKLGIKENLGKIKQTLSDRGIKYEEQGDSYLFTIKGEKFKLIPDPKTKKILVKTEISIGGQKKEEQLRDIDPEKIEELNNFVNILNGLAGLKKEQEALEARAHPAPVVQPPKAAPVAPPKAPAPAPKLAPARPGFDVEKQLGIKPPVAPAPPLKPPEKAKAAKTEQELAYERAQAVQDLESKAYKAVSMDKPTASDYKKAATYLEEAFNKDPKNPKNFEYLRKAGNMRASAGEFLEARELYEKVIKLKPSDESTKILLEQLKRDHPTQAEKQAADAKIKEADAKREAERVAAIEQKKQQWPKEIEKFFKEDAGLKKAGIETTKTQTGTQTGFEFKFKEKDETYSGTLDVNAKKLVNITTKVSIVNENSIAETRDINLGEIDLVQMGNILSLINQLPQKRDAKIKEIEKAIAAKAKLAKDKKPAETGETGKVLDDLDKVDDDIAAKGRELKKAKEDSEDLTIEKGVRTGIKNQIPEIQKALEDLERRKTDLISRLSKLPKLTEPEKAARWPKDMEKFFLKSPEMEAAGIIAKKTEKRFEFKIGDFTYEGTLDPDGKKLSDIKVTLQRIMPKTSEVKTYTVKLGDIPLDLQYKDKIIKALSEELPTKFKIEDKKIDAEIDKNR